LPAIDRRHCLHALALCRPVVPLPTPDRRPPPVPEVIRYEHPLNERVRTMMRLEDIYRRVEYFSARSGEEDHHAALLALFEITDVAARADLKTDILQELERQKQVLAPLRNNPAIETRVLDPLLAEIDRAAAELLAQAGKVGQHLRDNEWLMMIKQRAGIPGGVCEFDLPAYHYWLNLDAATRQRELTAWIAPFLPIRNGLSIVLRLLRDNGRATRQTAYRGVFQLMLTSGKVAQLLRLTLPRELACVPEISANKYALNIRFIGAIGADRGTVFDRDVDFELTFCNL
jgi:cell division protein ZapD